MEATAKCYKEQRAQSELVDIRYYEGHARLTGAPGAKWGRVSGVTVQLGEDLLGSPRRICGVSMHAVSRHRCGEARSEQRVLVLDF